MEKEFIPYEQALELKELGFDEPCFNYYDGDKNKNSINLGNGYVTKYMVSDNFVTAPTFSQAFRWFREKYEISFYVWRKDRGIFKIVLERLNQNSYFFNDEFKTYEEAELECLKKLIQIVKEQK